ncbi:MAG: hypothetical protein M3Q99_19495, partial [Acidobacteriota bacterium]|nr:hypothetical protein [Acidobacteriota bacterium]
GNLANVGANNLTNATAIGAGAIVSQSNSLILGNNVNVGIGTSTPNSKLTVVGLIETTTGGVKFPDGTIQTTAGGGAGVTSLNGLTNNVTLAAGANITITPSGNTLTFSSTGGGNGGILNQTTQQAGANFNIDGTGTANIFNAATQFNLGGDRILSALGSNNLFIGIGAGQMSSTSGGRNTFVGAGAGLSNVSGAFNAFFGDDAGRNSIANENAFFGSGAGSRNTFGHRNSIFGAAAGSLNQTGTHNSFFGFSAGNNNQASRNSFFGNEAGGSNLTGANNTFLGEAAGVRNESGSNNTFVGKSAGTATILTGNVSGSNNTLIGANTDVLADNLNYATAIGADARVSTSNTVVIGRPADTVNIPGTLTKAAGSFKIDHPLDPANKTLSHSFVESPDMMNIYNGNITTDGKGKAIVMLPEWFEALNKDFRYQLTVIGTFAQAIVAREMQGNRFTIKTDAPRIKVSWQVTGIRKDAYADRHRIPVEEDKSASERGSYLHPEAYALPKTTLSPGKSKAQRTQKKTKR